MVCLHEFTASHVISLLASHREDPVVGRARYFHASIAGSIRHFSSNFESMELASSVNKLVKP